MAASFEPNLHRPTITPQTNLATMQTRTREAEVPLLDDRIDILNRNAGDASPANQVFRTVSTILALIRDKMIHDEDSIQLAGYCFNICEVLKTAIRGNDVDDLDEPVKVALRDLEGIVCEIERALKEMNIPHTRYSKGEIEGHKLEIQQILRTLHEPNSPLSENSGTGELAPADTRGTAAASVSDSACLRLIRRAFVLPEFPSLVEAIFSSKDGGDAVHRLLGDDAQTFIDVIDEALDWPNLSPSTRNKCLKLLYRTCGHHALLPSALKIPTCYDRTGVALYRGGFADVWKGKYLSRDVAVKVIRTYSNSDLQKVIGRFCKEVVMWKTLRHPNVLPLIGVTMSETQFTMVSDWMVNGNINDFVKAHPDANRLELLGGVARGLIYIHCQGMTHGDLKGANILIDQTNCARLADFGLLTIISDSKNFLTSSSDAQGGTARWMSPELIDPQRFGFESSRPTKHSDCYALGMVIYETISGHLPFHHHGDLTVFVKVLAGERPPREAGFTDGLWKMLESCWAPQPNSRPNVSDILRILVPKFSTSPSPGVNGEMGSYEDQNSASRTVGLRRKAAFTFLSTTFTAENQSRSLAPPRPPTDLSVESGKSPAVRETPTESRPNKVFVDSVPVIRTVRSNILRSPNSSRIVGPLSWSELAEDELVVNLGARERTRQEVLFEIVSSEDRYVSELAEMKETFINHLLHLSPQPNTPAPGTSSGDSKSYDEYLRPRHSESLGILSPAYQLPEDLQMCLEVLGGELLEGHVRLNEALKKRYDEQYPLVRSLADVFIRNSEILTGYAKYILHLERALEQVDNAIKCVNETARKPSKKQDNGQLLKIGVHLQRLEEIAIEKGETGLAISLSKPFQRLLKYPLMFQNLLFHTDPSTFDYESTLQMVAEVETIVRSIEDEKIQKDDRDKTRDVLGRIDGLDKVKQLAVPKPSRVLVEERMVVQTEPSGSGTPSPRVRSSFKRLGDVLQPKSNGIGGKKDLWFVVFNDVVLRCQRTGTTSLPIGGASYGRADSMPEMQGKMRYASSRNPRAKLRNLYKFIEIETRDISNDNKPGEGVAVDKQPRIMPLADDNEGEGAGDSDGSDKQSKMTFSYWGADKVTLRKPVTSRPRQATHTRPSVRRGLGPGIRTYGNESLANAKFGTRLVSAESNVPRPRPPSRRIGPTSTPNNDTTKVSPMLEDSGVGMYRRILADDPSLAS